MRVERGQSDQKEYEYFNLNGLKVLVVSNQYQLSQSGEVKAAAALACQVGSFDDPDEIHGLSHFLEHMLFMGSEKYSGENDYDSFITSRGGYANAYTESEHTVYTFEIPHHDFPEALDRFASCFIAPLLNLSSSERELQAIENEFNSAVTDDESRLEDILCRNALPSHFLRKFSWGNIESLVRYPSSLGINVHDKLRDHFDEYYYPANCMLALVAPFPLQQLIQIVNSSFSRWEREMINQPVKIQCWPQNPFPLTPSLFRIVPIEQSHIIKICWPLPPTLSRYHSKSDEYLGHLIGHEGVGSILQALKTLGFAHEIVAGVGSNGVEANSHFSLFSVSIDLTPRGVILWTQVVKVVFQYIYMLQSNELPEWVFHELREMGRLQYDFEDEIEVDEFVSQLAVEMTAPYAREPRELLSASHLLTEWKPDEIKLLLDQMIPERCHVYLQSSMFGESDGEDNIENGSEEDDDNDDEDASDSEEDDDESTDSDVDEESLCDDDILLLSNSLPESFRSYSFLPSANQDAKLQSFHFGTEYWQDIINEDILRYWKDPLSFVTRTENTLHLPSPNLYLPQELTLLSPTKTKKHLKKGTTISLSNSEPANVLTSIYGRALHVSTFQFKVPKVVIKVSLISSYMLQITSQNSEVPPLPLLFVFNDLLPRILTDYLTEDIYMARMAYLECDIESTTTGMTLSVSGFHDKATLLASTILKSFFDINPIFQDKRINRQIEKLRKMYLNHGVFASEAATSQRLQALLPSYVPRSRRLEALDLFLQSKHGMITSLKKYQGDFLSSCFCEILVQGNISRQRTISFSQSIFSLIEKKRHKMKSKSPHRTLFSHLPNVFVRSLEAASMTSFNISPKSEHERNVCFQIYFQIGLTNPRDLSFLNLIERIMEEPLFNELRTQQQLGYDLSCFTAETYSMLGFTIEVVSSSHTLSHIRESVLTFLNSSFSSLLKNMDETSFSTYRRAVISQLQTPPLSIIELAEENWTEIEDRRYHFTSKVDRVDLLPSITLDEVRNFFEFYFMEYDSSHLPQNSNPNRRVMIIQSSREAN